MILFVFVTTTSYAFSSPKYSNSKGICLPSIFIPFLIQKSYISLSYALSNLELSILLLAFFEFF